MFTFIQKTAIPRSADEVYAWHAAGGALNKLIPPWQKVTVVMHDGIDEGSVAVLRIHLGPLRIVWQALHTDVIPGRQFRDVQLVGPFTSWTHTHRMIPTSPNSCLLVDEVHCEVPGGRVVNALARPFLRRMLKRLFAHRHAVTLNALAPRVEDAAPKNPFLLPDERPSTLQNAS